MNSLKLTADDIYIEVIDGCAEIQIFIFECWDNYFQHEKIKFVKYPQVDM